MPGGDGGPPDTSSSVLDSADAIHSGMRLKVRRFEFDGGRSYAGIFDQLRKEVCFPGRLEDGELRCIPQFASSQGVFADAQCMQPIGFNGTLSCPPLDYFRITTRNPTALKLFRRSTAAPPAQYYSLSPPTCGGPHDAEGPYQLSFLAEEVAAGDFSPLAFTEFAGDGRFRVRYYSSPDGAQLRSSSMFDNELPDDCSLTPTADVSTIRCRPVNKAVFAVDSYVDSSCTVRGAGVSRTDPVPYAAVFDTNCPFQFYVGTYRIGNRSATLSSYSKHDSTCSKNATDTTVDYYELGPELELPALARVPGPAGPRLDRLRYTDGNTIFDVDALYDNMLDTRCSAKTFSDGSVRCLPPSQLTANLRYSDSACEHPIYIGEVPPACGTQAPPKYSVNSPPVCSSGLPITDSYEVHRVGALYPGDVYLKTEFSCLLTQPAGTRYLLGDAIPLEQFAKMTPVDDP